MRFVVWQPGQFGTQVCPVIPSRLGRQRGLHPHGEQGRVPAHISAAEQPQCHRRILYNHTALVQVLAGWLRTETGQVLAWGAVRCNRLRSHLRDQQYPVLHNHLSIFAG